jgi:hypothetical protein
MGMMVVFAMNKNLSFETLSQRSGGWMMMMKKQSICAELT